MKIRNKQRYGQFIYLICFVQTIIQENVLGFAKIQNQPQIIFQGVHGFPLNRKSYYTPPSPPAPEQQQELQKRGGKGMDRHLFASAAAATLAMGTAAMGVSTYSIRLNDWHKYKGGQRKEEKDKKPRSIDTKAANKDKNKDSKPSSPGSPKYYNSRVTVNNYYGAQKPPPAPPAKPAPPPPKEEAGKKQKRSLETDEEMQYPIRKRNKFKSAGKGLNRVISGAYSTSCTTFTTFCVTTTKLMHSSSSSSTSLITTEVSSASSASSRVGRSTKAAGKTFGEMIGKAKPVREGKAGHIPAVSSSSEPIGKAHHPRAHQTKSSSPSRRPTQGTLPSHTSPPTENHSVTKGEKLNRKNVDQINPVTGKAYAPDTHFLGHDMSKHDKWAKFAGRVEDYGKVSAATGAFTAAGIALHTTVLQHNHDAEKAKKEGKEEEKKKD